MNKNSLTRQRWCKACCAPAVVDDWGWCCVGSVWLAEHYSVPHRVLFCKVSCHTTSVKVQNVCCTLFRYTVGCCSVSWPVDNSDSPSIVEQSQQGTDSSCILLFISCLQPEEYPMPYAYCLASCSVGWRLYLGVLLPLNVSWCFLLFSLSTVCCFLPLLLLRVFSIVPWDSLSGLCALWGSLSSFPSLLLGRCTLGWLVWPVIGFPLLGVHPSISIVKLIVIGYCCNCLDGQLSYQAFTHWLICVTIMYQLCYWWLGFSTHHFYTTFTAHTHKIKVPSFRPPKVSPQISWNFFINSLLPFYPQNHF